MIEGLWGALDNSVSLIVNAWKNSMKTTTYSRIAFNLTIHHINKYLGPVVYQTQRLEKSVR